MLAQTELAPEMILSADLDLVATIERFDVEPARQKEAIALASAAIVDRWQADAGFVAALILRGREQGGLAIYAQWRKSDVGAFPLVPATARSLRETLDRFPLVDSRNYELAFTRQTMPMMAPTRISLEGTPLIHFGIFDVTRDNQPVMLERARMEAPNSFGTPGLLAINFHRSADGLQVINLGAWNSFDSFAALHAKPSFKPGEQYFQGISEFRAAFFDLVGLVTAFGRSCAQQEGAKAACDHVTLRLGTR